MATKNPKESNEFSFGRTFDQSIKTILIILILPVMVSILGPIYEYKAGFVTSKPNIQVARVVSLLTPVLCLLVVAGALFAIYATLIWLLRRHFFRENFASSVFMSLIAWAIAVVICLVTKTMPWTYFDIFIAFIYDTEVHSKVVSISEYALLVISYSFYSYVLMNMYKGWNGLTSSKQFRSQLEGEPDAPLSEGFAEISRIVKGDEILQKHVPIEALVARSTSSAISHATSVNPIWKDEARDLVRLAYSSYEFSKETDWHENAQCWLGRNRDTDKSIILFPIKGALTAEQVDKALCYSNELKSERGQKVEKVIVIVKNNIPKIIYQIYQDVVTFMSGREMLDKLVNWSDYKDEIFRRVEEETLPESIFHIKDVYVPSRYFSQNSSDPRMDIERYIIRWLSEPGQRQLALLGEYGHGKSTAALMLSYKLLKGLCETHGRIPILVELRGRNPRNQNPLQLFGDWSAQYGLSPQALMRLHYAGKLLIIFEGFDEMSLVGDAEMRLGQFVALWSFCHDNPKAKILITGRPNFFLDEREMEDALGMISPRADRPYCEAVRLAPFSVEQIDQSLAPYDESVRKQINELAQKYQHFLDLISRPSLLHIVAALWVKEHLFAHAENLSSARVLDLFVEHSYRRQGLKEAASPTFMALTEAERKYFMRGIAAYMIVHHQPNEISSVQLHKVIDQLIESIPDAVSAQASSISGEVKKPLRERIETADPSVALPEQIHTDVRTCGLLVASATEPRRFRFGHKSFLEYLFASVASEFVTDRSEIAVSILQACGGRIGDIIDHPVSVRFMAELIGIGKYSDMRAAEQKKQALKLMDAIVFNGIKRGYIGRSLFFLVGLYNEAISPLRNVSSTLHTVAYWAPVVVPGFALPIVPRIIPWFWVVAISDMMIFSYGSWFQTQRKSFYREGYHRRLGLWAFMCRKIGITERILHEVATPRLYFWIYKKQFDFCISYVHSALERGSYNGLQLEEIEGLRIPDF